MKQIYFAAIPLLLAAVPASATQGFSCRTTDPQGVRVTVVTGTGQPGGVALVTLREGRSFYSTGATGQPVAIGEVELDNRNLVLELVDPEDQRPVAHLEARRADDVSDLDGTLEYTGRVYRIACRTDQ